MDFRFKFRRGRPSGEEQSREQREDGELARRMRGMAYGVSIPFSLVAGPVAGWFAGSWLDQHYGTSFWLPVLILLFTAAAMWTVIEMLLRLGRS